MCFVRISEQTAIISHYNINWLIFVTEKESVYCAVRAECLRIVHFINSFKGLSKSRILSFYMQVNVYTYNLDKKVL